MDLTIGIAIVACAAFVVTATVLPLVRHDRWWIRAFDFPRWQVAGLGAVTLIANIYYGISQGLTAQLLSVLLGACVLYQFYRILPYTPLYPAQVIGATRRSEQSVSLMVANVLQTNRDASRLLQLVHEHKPDVFLTVETDTWWERKLATLESQFPHVIKEPLENTYGMMLFSKLELENPRIEYILKDDVPSIHTELRLTQDLTVRLYALHPQPPYPREAQTTSKRDAELLIVGRRVRDNDQPAIVAGDLNDVAWSYTTTLFQKTSGLLDPRIGRGMFNTFSAKQPLLRWPLDHVYHSDHFKLVDIKRLPAFGSDHFPILVVLNYDPIAPDEQQPPSSDTEEREHVRAKIAKATN